MNLIDNLFSDLSFKSVSLDNMSEELFAMYVWQILNKKNKNILLVTSNLIEANKLFQKISLYTNDAYLFPMDDFLTSEAIAISPDLLITRLETLKAIQNDKPLIVITHLMGYLHFLPNKKIYKDNILTISTDMEISHKTLIEKLQLLGYKRETIVTKTGELGVRGFIIDLFPLGESHPIRLEFFGDTIESIRSFDENTQRSLEHLDKITIYPCTEFLVDTPLDEDEPPKPLDNYIKVDSIQDYLTDSVTIYKDPSSIKTVYENIVTDVKNYTEEKNIKTTRFFFPYKEKYQEDAISYFSIDSAIESKKEIISFNTKNPPQFYEDTESIEKYLSESLMHSKTIIISLKDYQKKSLMNKLNLPSIDTNLTNIELGKINYISLEMEEGFIYKDYIFLTANELFQKKTINKKYKTNFKYGSKITDINKLEIGDYVVHQSCGIGIYNGLKTLKQGEQLKDYVEVLYQDNDKLYIPVEKIDLISKYSGNEGVMPKINKLGGSDWNKIKARVKSKIHDIADKLLKLYAEREMREGYAFSKDTELQKQFDASFEYTETKDQLLAIEQIKNDMESRQPMDRLLCGDVGYGKTEVAFRAVFKAVMDSKQVLYLCPTTILSNQQYQNALVRFKDFPVNIGLLNRFTSPKEKKRILSELENGTIDFVIGTHRLLSNDIKPKDLGLLIIDEEQRFGVTHKEKIKEYKSNVDVLTLTATPIPRTLQMSMIGIRSLSLIETPPVDRYPVQTYVIEENKQIIKDAIYKEMSRNGQVFLLYNHVDSIERKVSEIQNLVPEARIIFAHGRLTKEELEDRMIAFINHEYDILICTTIIETGIDIPNANTLIILDADHFGLSQLYQIRGRVGRSNKIAYAYLMYSPSKMLNEVAIKRLNAIKDFTELGSGFSIATRDLSIRGAGDILGSEQAGFIDTVGIDLYLKMLQDEISRLKGITPKEEIIQNEKPLLNVSTHISNNYTDDDQLKISIHKEINTIDSLDKLKEVQLDLEDRFGKLDEDVIIYMYQEWFEKMAKELGIEKVNYTKNSLELVVSEEATTKIDGEKLFVDAFHITPMFRFKMLSNQLIIILDTVKLEKHYIYYLVDLLLVQF